MASSMSTSTSAREMPMGLSQPGGSSARSAMPLSDKSDLYNSQAVPTMPVFGLPVPSKLDAVNTTERQSSAMQTAKALLHSPERRAGPSSTSRRPISPSKSAPGLRSPPPAGSSTSQLRAKRVFSATINSSDAQDQPMKRPNLGSVPTKYNRDAASSRPSSLSSTSLHVRRPVFPVAGFTSRTGVAAALPAGSTSARKITKAPSLFHPPNLGNASTSQPKLQAKRVSLAPLATENKAAVSALSLSPSKFGLTVPTEFNFARSATSPLRFTNKNTCFGSVTHPTAGGLAPSPIAADQHVPRPLPTTLSQHALPPAKREVGNGVTQMPRSDSSSSLTASPRSFQSAFKNPFQAGEKSKVLPPDLTVPSSPDMRPVEPQSNTPSPIADTTAFDMRSENLNRVDHVWRETTSEPLAPPAVCNTVHVNDTTDSNYTKTAEPHSRIQVSENIGQSGVPLLAAPSIPERSPAEKLLAHLEATRPQAAQPVQSPLKRPLSPTEASMSAKERAVRQRTEELARASRPVSHLPRRQSMRQASRASLATGHGRDTVDDFHQNQALLHSSQYAKARRSVDSAPPRYQPASAGGSAPITRPAMSRILSAPLPTSGAATMSDIFKAPAMVMPAHEPKPSVPSSNATRSPPILEEGDSGSTLDGDTSIMSASAQSSLANLQSLLSKMSTSRPSLSRRISSQYHARPPVLTEEAEMEGILSGAPPKASTSNLHQGLPRYAAPTTSSNARQSRASNEPVDKNALQHARARDPTRRVSAGVPTVPRGSLLPMAASSNAARNAFSHAPGGVPRIAVQVDSDAGGADAATADNASEIQPGKSTVLRNVVAFVDVKTAEGDEAGGVFADILRSLGARVLARPTDSITHIIYKGGRQATIQRYRSYPQDRKPFLLGVGWIVRCRELNERVSEGPFLVNADQVDTGVLLGGQAAAGKRTQPLASASNNAQASNRRKSMEPKVLFPAPPPTRGLLPPGQPTLHAFGVFRDGDSGRSDAGERARHKTLKFAPKIGSPLKQRVFNAHEEDEASMQDDENA